MPAQIKTKLFQLRRYFFLYTMFMRVHTQNFQRVLKALVDSCVEIKKKKCPFSSIINSGGAWRKVPESDANYCRN